MSKTVFRKCFIETTHYTARDKRLCLAVYQEWEKCEGSTWEEICVDKH